MTRGDVVRQPIAALKDAQGRFSRAIGDDHDHFVAARAVEKRRFIVSVGRLFKAEKRPCSNGTPAERQTVEIRWTKRRTLRIALIIVGEIMALTKETSVFRS